MPSAFEGCLLKAVEAAVGREAILDEIAHAGCSGLRTGLVSVKSSSRRPVSLLYACVPCYTVSLGLS
jgi:hypothetical protein